MELAEIKEILVRCIVEIQELNGLPLADVHDSICPVGDLEEFDSLIMVELAVRLSALIGVEIEDEIFYANPDSAHGRASSLTIREIVDKIYQTIISQRG